jgi:ribosomal protein S18 acetylase RimI-like enzyme
MPHPYRVRLRFDLAACPPLVQRRGIGHRLLAYAEGYTFAERAQSLQIVVEEGNEQAPELLPTLGL